MSSPALAQAVRQVRERQFGAEPRVGQRADDQRVTPRCQVGRRPVDARRIVGLEYDFGCQTKLDGGPAGRLPASSEMEAKHPCAQMGAIQMTGDERPGQSALRRKSLAA